MELHRFAIVHRPDGEEMFVKPVVVKNLDATWALAKQRYPGQKLMIIDTDDEDD